MGQPFTGPHAPGMPGVPATPPAQKQPSKIDAFFFDPNATGLRLGGFRLWRWIAFAFFIISLLLGLFGLSVVGDVFESVSSYTDVSLILTWSITATGFFGMWASAAMIVLCSIGERIQQQNGPAA